MVITSQEVALYVASVIFIYVFPQKETVLRHFILYNNFYSKNSIWFLCISCDEIYPKIAYTLRDNTYDDSYPVDISSEMFCTIIHLYLSDPDVEPTPEVIFQCSGQILDLGDVHGIKFVVQFYNEYASFHFIWCYLINTFLKNLDLLVILRLKSSLRMSPLQCLTNSTLLAKLSLSLKGHGRLYKADDASISTLLSTIPPRNEILLQQSGGTYQKTKGGRVLLSLI